MNAPTMMRALLAAVCLSPTLQAVACGSDFVLGDEVGAAHPASIGVAFAMLDARNAGALPPAAASASNNSRVSADAAAHMLEQRLTSDRAGMPVMSMLLVESRLWTRYAPLENGSGADEENHAVHAVAPGEDDVVLVTGAAVLRGLLAGDIAWQQAIDSGLVVLTGDPARRARVSMLLDARFTQPGVSAVVDRTSPAHF